MMSVLKLRRCPGPCDIVRSVKRDSIVLLLPGTMSGQPVSNIYLHYFCDYYDDLNVAKAQK